MSCTCPPTRPPFDAILDPACPEHGDQATALLIEAIDTGRLIAERPPGRCELCGTIAETRPYGPGDKEVCFDCAMKDEKTAEAAFLRRLEGRP